MPVYLNIIDVLGSRLYSGKVSWLREYVQNSIDARSEKIIIKLKDKDLCIEDDGEGISKEKLEKEAFSPGGSSKEPSQIGELGVGLFAGTGICDQIKIITKQEGGSPYEAIFDVKKYREIMEKDKFSLFDDYIASIYSISSFDQNFQSADHFTKLMLINLDGSAVTELTEEMKGTWSNPGIKGYLERTLDIPLAEKFPLRSELRSFLQCKEKSSFNIEPKVSITVEIGDKSEEIRKFMFIDSEFIDFLYKRTFSNSKGEPVAKIWAAYSKDGLEFTGSRFVVKFKGMTVGDDRTVSVKTEKRVEHRILGEAIALSNNLKINAERDWFIQSQELTEFLEALKEAVSELFSISNDDSTLMKAQVKLENDNYKLGKEISKLNPRSTVAIDKMKTVKENNELLETLRNEADRRTSNLMVGKRHASDSAKSLIQKIYDERKRTIADIKGGSELEKVKEVQSEEKAPRISPIPKTVKNFLTEQIIDRELSKKIKGKDDVKDMSNNAFTYVEILLKTKLEIPEKEHVEFSHLIKKFLTQYEPSNIPKGELNNFKESFSQYLKGTHYFWKNPSSHEFMEAMRDERYLFQGIMIADFVVKLINDFTKKS